MSDTIRVIISLYSEFFLKITSRNEVLEKKSKTMLILPRLLSVRCGWTICFSRFLHSFKSYTPDIQPISENYVNMDGGSLAYLCEKFLVIAEIHFKEGDDGFGSFVKLVLEFIGKSKLILGELFIPCQ